MKLYTTGDLHLSQTSEKPMDVFGDGWKDHTGKIIENWNLTVKDGDVVVICGDISWGIKLGDCLEDFKLLDLLPGKKILLKGNHDYFWSTHKSMLDFFEANELKSFSILHNNFFAFENVAICGTKGWFFGSQDSKESDEKIRAREFSRLHMSLEKAHKSGYEQKYVFLHYPPVFDRQEVAEFIELMREYGVKKCFYAHLHGSYAHYHSINGTYKDIDMQLVSADFLDFWPYEVEMPGV